MRKPEWFWDRVAASYDKTEERFEPAHVKTVKNALKFLNTGDIVLDYGCATGKKALEIAGHVKMLHGLDISSKMIEGARQRASEQNVENVEFAHGTIFDERYDPESFDAILAFNILHGFTNGQGEIRRIHDLLKPGGWFISVTPCLGEKMSWSNRAQFSVFFLLSRLGVIPYVGVLKTPELEAIIAGGNFQIVETETFFHGISGCFVAAKKT